MDNLLSEWIPGYNSFKGNSDSTFSLKIELTKSLKLIPGKILNAITPIRKIRNVFAHDLNIKSFNEAKLRDEKLEKKDQSFWRLQVYINELAVDASLTTEKENFNRLVFLISYALCLYRVQVKHMSEKVRSIDFTKEVFGHGVDKLKLNM